MNTPPAKPGSTKAKSDNLPIDQQLDELLAKIEAAEPGAIDPDVLPESVREELSTPANTQPSDSAELEIEALLNAPPSASAPAAAPTPVTPEPAPEPEPAASTTTPDQADMLAALNSALQGLGSDPPADTAEPSEETPADPSPIADESMSMEDKLQAEIAALMSAGPQDSAAPEQAETAPAAEVTAQVHSDEAFDEFDGIEGTFESPDSLALMSESAGSAPSSTTEDLIAQEIEGLLNSDLSEPTANASADTAIDELDKMLAQEIDADDDLAGDFHSVEQLTAGIQIPDAVASTLEDHDAATASDVAAELDSQPEDLPAASYEPVSTAHAPSEDPLTALDELAQKTEQNEQAHQKRAAMKQPDWAHWLDVAKEKLLSTCYLINWPARRFLNNEWRATLGLISLTFAFTSSIFLLVVLLFG